MLVPFVGGEADGHFGDDACEDGAEAFVEGEWGFAFYDRDAGLDEPSTRALFWIVRLNAFKGEDVW